jgi:hypothetical protein
MTASNAEVLARRVQEYWHNRGHKNVRAWSERGKSITGNDLMDTFVVCSNLFNGLPPEGEALEPAVIFENCKIVEAPASVAVAVFGNFSATWDKIKGE